MSEYTQASELFFRTVRVIVRSHAGNATDNPEIATAFVVQGESAAAKRHYLVTARHVVERAEAATLIFFADRRPEGGFGLFHFEQETRFGEIWYYPLNRAID